MRANQMRMYFSAMVYVLVCGLRRLGLKDTELEKAQAATMRMRLLKIGAQVRVSVRESTWQWRRATHGRVNCCESSIAQASTLSRYWNSL
jgi:Transposase DDE domain group 1